MSDMSPDNTPDGLPLETETVAGVALPATCRDRVDDEQLADVVAVLDAHSVTEYTVSPVGGLQIQIGIHRPNTVQESLMQSLRHVSDSVSEHGIANGYARIRVDITTTESDNI